MAKVSSIIRVPAWLRCALVTIAAAGCTQRASRNPGDDAGVIVEAESTPVYVTPDLFPRSYLHVHLSANNVVSVQSGYSPQGQTTTSDLFLYVLAFAKQDILYPRVLLCVDPDVSYGSFIEVLGTASRGAVQTVLNPPHHEDAHVMWDDPEVNLVILDNREGYFLPCTGYVEPTTSRGLL
jgi:hypothetical protein